MVDSSKPDSTRILLVDDDEVLLEAFKLHLSSRFEVDTAISGEQAVRLVQENSYSVVISDMHMDSMNGIEFIIEAKKILPKAIYMLLTASRDSKTAVSALNDAEVYCIINKPCSMADLDNFVDAACSEIDRLADSNE